MLQKRQICQSHRNAKYFKKWNYTINVVIVAILAIKVYLLKNTYLQGIGASCIVSIKVFKKFPYVKSKSPTR